MAEQRYQAVMAVIGDGLSISQVAEKVGVSRQTLHAWLARYEAEGLEGLKDRSHRPVRCPHQMGAEVEAMLLETGGLPSGGCGDSSAEREFPSDKVYSRDNGGIVGVESLGPQCLRSSSSTPVLDVQPCRYGSPLVPGRFGP